jgi:hypothetical protein
MARRRRTSSTKVYRPEPVLWLANPGPGNENLAFVDVPILTVNLNAADPSQFYLDPHDGMRSDMSDEDAGLAAYFFALESVRSSGPTRKRKDGLPPFEWERLGRASDASTCKYNALLAREMRNARILSFLPEHYLVTYAQADKWTTEQAGVEFHHDLEPPRAEEIGEEAMLEESHRIMDFTVNTGRHYPLTDKIPFDAVWLSYGYGVPLSLPKRLGKAVAHGFSLKAMESHQVWLIGHLVLRSGYVHEFLGVSTGSETGVFFSPRRVPRLEMEAHQGDAAKCLYGTPPPPDQAHEWTWTEPYDLLPFVVEGLFDSIGAYGTTIVGGNVREKGRLSVQSRWKKSAKVFGHKSHKIPPPFYVVDLEKRVLQERREAGFQPPEPKNRLSYQHDRWGHTRVRVRRGPISKLTEKKIAELQRSMAKSKGEAKLFIEEELDKDTIRLLIDRAIPLKREGEWMIVTVTWIDDMLVPANPPAGMEYVPARRRVPRVRGEGAARIAANGDSK